LKGSGDWLLSDEEKFLNWKERGGLLWLLGIRQWLLPPKSHYTINPSAAGAGKTKLTYFNYKLFA
jgi:hypothetical protein